MKSNKKLIVIISIVLTLVVASVSLVYLFFMTDIFKSKEELFAKYFSQDIEALCKIIDLKSIDIYDNLRNETTYESSTNIKTTYSEGGEISNPLNNLSLKLDVQKNSNEQYLYANGKILFENEEEKAAFRAKWDWDRMTKQDETVWAEIFKTLDA